MTSHSPRRKPTARTAAAHYAAPRRTAPHRAALRYSQLRAFVLRRPRRVAAQLTRRAQRPMRIAQQLAREHDHVRLTAAHDRLGLLGTRDQPNRRRRNVRIASNTLGKLHLIARTDRNSHLRRDTAARAIDEVHTVAHEQTRKLDGLINGPTIVAPVRRREAYGQRKPLGPDFPDLTHDAPQESRAILERSTVFIVARVRDRRQEFVQQVAVRAVNLEHLHLGGERPNRGITKCRYHALDSFGVERARRLVLCVERNRARCIDGRPTAELRAQRAAALPWACRARLASGMREL